MSGNFVLSAFVLIAFIKLLSATDSARLTAGVYTAVMCVRGIIGVASGEMGILAAALEIALSGAIAFAYFWSLLRLNPWTGAWWSVVIGGALLTAVV